MDLTRQAGPLATEAHRTSVDRAVRRAVEDGGRLVCGGAAVDGPGWYYEPTIVDGVGADHPLFLDEVFGPVLAVTTCASTTEGIALANATKYGLSATGWSAEETETRLLADGLRAAWVTVNPHLGPPSDPRAGAESIGWSGSGVEGGLPTLRAATRLTVVSVAVPTSDGRT
ncbi:MAG: aldehyde dehydrogenase (NAD+) [Acidimicrobiaceae bacterium]|nr:MAG: aldehyde dehydrogenase (NAD+) [Acidimicrobiaceae bacterium]